MTTHELIKKIGTGYVPAEGKEEKYFVATGKNQSIGLRFEYVKFENAWRMWIMCAGVTCCISLLDIAMGHTFASGDFDFNVSAHEFNLPIVDLANAR